MNNKRSQRLPKIILGQLSVIFIIAALGLALVFYSQGFKINWKNFKVIKTGMVLLYTDPEPDQIIINGKDWGNAKKFSHTLDPGYYDITIKKDKYQDWQRTVYIAPEQLYALKDITLFYSNPKVSELSDQSKIDYLNAPNSYLAENYKNDLSYNKSEIWVNGRLVTRFSQEINSPVWYPDNDHVVYQIKDEIHIIEISGFNDKLLVKLASALPTKFAVGNKGKELYFLDDGAYKTARIK